MSTFQKDHKLILILNTRAVQRTHAMGPFFPGYVRGTGASLDGIRDGLFALVYLLGCQYLF